MCRFYSNRCVHVLLNQLFGSAQIDATLQPVLVKGEQLADEVLQPPTSRVVPNEDRQVYNEVP